MNDRKKLQGARNRSPSAGSRSSVSRGQDKSDSPNNKYVLLDKDNNQIEYLGVLKEVDEENVYVSSNGTGTLEREGASGNVAQIMEIESGRPSRGRYRITGPYRGYQEPFPPNQSYPSVYPPPPPNAGYPQMPGPPPYGPYGPYAPPPPWYNGYYGGYYGQQGALSPPPTWRPKRRRSAGGVRIIKERQLATYQPRPYYGRHPNPPYPPYYEDEYMVAHGAPPPSEVQLRELSRSPSPNRAGMEPAETEGNIDVVSVDDAVVNRNVDGNSTGRQSPSCKTDEGMISRAKPEIVQDVQKTSSKRTSSSKEDLSVEKPTGANETDDSDDMWNRIAAQAITKQVIQDARISIKAASSKAGLDNQEAKLQPTVAKISEVVQDVAALEVVDAVKLLDQERDANGVGAENVVSECLINRGLCSSTGAPFYKELHCECEAISKWWLMTLGDL